MRLGFNYPKGQRMPLENVGGPEQKPINLTEQRESPEEKPTNPMEQQESPVQKPANPIEQQESSLRTNADSEGSGKNATGQWEKAKRVIEVVALFVLLLYTFFAGAQWLSLLASNQINRDALQSVQRAFIVFTSQMDATGVVDAKTGKIAAWHFALAIDNVGTTPTRGMTYHINASSRLDEIPPTFSYPDVGDLTPAPLMIGPKARIYSGDLQVSSEIIQAIQQGKVHLYFYGWATYRDVFSGTPEHVTKFCFEMKRFYHDAFVPGGTTQMAFLDMCPRHNCADEDCNNQ
jgi:hypothetical protein